MSAPCTKPILFNGEWMSAYRISKLTGISSRTITTRAESGLPLAHPGHLPRRGKQYLFRGEMRTVAAVAAITGTDNANIYRRIEGDRIREALPRTSRSLNVFYDGKTLALSEWSQVTGLPHDVIYRRLARGWPVGKALTTPLQLRKRRERRKR